MGEKEKSNKKEKKRKENPIATDGLIDARPSKSGKVMYYPSQEALDIAKKTNVTKAYIKKIKTASPEDVNKFLTAVMFGQVKDRFGLDVGIDTRIKSAEILAKNLATQDSEDVKDSGVTIIDDIPNTTSSCED